MQIKSAGLPNSPWSAPAKSSDAEGFRDRCEEFIKVVISASSVSGSHWDKDFLAYILPIKQLVNAIFDPMTSKTQDDRIALIHWLGRASAWRGPQGEMHAETPMIETCVGLIIHRWTSQAINKIPQLDRHEWVQKFMGRIKVGGLYSSYFTNEDFAWAPLSPDKKRGTTTILGNAQRDFLVFLDGFQEQADTQQAEAEIRDGWIDAVEVISQCCVTLSIIDSTTDLVDPKVLRRLHFFEQFFDHSHVDVEIQRQALSMAELKILKQVSGRGENEPGRAARARKI